MIGDWSSAFLRFMWNIIVTELEFYALKAFNSPAKSWQGCIQLWSAFTSAYKHERKSLRLRKGEAAWPGSTCWEHQNVAEAWHVSKECYQKQAACIEFATSFAELYVLLISMNCCGWKPADWHTDQPAYIDFAVIVKVMMIIIVIIIIIIIIIAHTSITIHPLVSEYPASITFCGSITPFTGTSPNGDFTLTRNKWLCVSNQS